MKRADAAKELLARRKARSNLHDFILYINEDYIVSDFSKKVCEKIDSFLVSMMNGERPVLVLGAPPQHGKQCDIKTPVLTTDGWKNHGELCVGDMVFHPSGKPIKVVNYIPQKEHCSLEVELSNGEKIKVHPHHEWTVTSHDWNNYKTLETKDLLAKGLVIGVRGKRGSRYRFQLPKSKSLQCKEKCLPLDPYVLGVWLGDGTQTKPYITYDEKDIAVVNEVVRRGHPISVTYTHKTTGVKTSKIENIKDELLSIGVFAKKYGVRSKHIPVEYITASERQRLELLAGLIDTDGYAYKRNGRYVFTTADRLLADTFCELVSSFGWGYSFVTEEPKVSSSGIVGKKDYYVIGFNPQLNIPCVLERKRCKSKENKRKVSIVNIRNCAPTKGNCITVDSPDGLYLVGKTMQPTHNSDIVSRYLPAYFFGKYPDQRVAGLSYGKDLATDMNRDVQRIMMGNKYHNLFPGSSLNTKRVVTIDVEAKRNSETFEIVGRKGSYISQGVGGPLTGKKVDLGIIDDPIKNAKEALSETTKKGVWNWYTSTFITRLSKNSGQIIMATRWAEDDLSGRVLEKIKNAVNLAFKAISDTGKALVPELHPIEKLLETKKILGEYFWSAMYQQSPTALGGDMFKSEHWKYYTSLPPIRRKAIFADTALKAKEANDYSVLQCWGESYEGRLYLIDQLRGKWEAPELEINAKAFYNKHRKADNCVCSAFYVEDKASGIGLIQTLQRKGGIPIVGVPREIDKITRMHSATPSIQAGLVYLPEDAPWLLDYMSEFNAAPNGTNDDQIDPTIDAIEEFLGGGIINYEDIL